MMSLIDRDDCCMPRCRQTAMMTYLGTPMCQQCWNKHCAAEDAKEVKDRKDCRGWGNDDCGCDECLRELEKANLDNAEDAKELDKWVSEGGSSHIPNTVTPIRTLLDDFSD